MVDREKVIKGLECCAVGCRSGCLYSDIDDCESVLCADALALLKAQEPRVMTLEEVSSTPKDDGDNAPMWVETRIVTDRGVLTRLEASLLWMVEDGWWRRFGPVHSGWEDRKADSYDVTWRCWTSRPDEKRRTEAPWN